MWGDPTEQDDTTDSNNNDIECVYTDLHHVRSHTEIASIACSRCDILLLTIQQGFLCDLVGIESARKTKPCRRKENGKMLLGALQDAWVTRCVRATQRKRGKSSRWLSDASFMSRSCNNGKTLLSSSNIQHDKQRFQKKGFPQCVSHCAGREVQSKGTEQHDRAFWFIQCYADSLYILISCCHLSLVDHITHVVTL